MDGTYNNPYAQGQSQSPLSPQTPGGYQVNVNRQKTRKWVQAPVQNYDGDDWGADEFDDDEPPPPPVPRVTTGLRSIGQRPAESYGPSPRLAAAVASSSRGSSGPPSLQLQTQHSAASSNVAPPEQIHNISSPVAGRNGSPAPVSSGAGSSKPPSLQQQPDFRSSTPQSASSSARASPSIRPDLYRHIDDERKLGGSPLSIAENVAPKPNDHSTPPVHESNQQGHGKGAGPAVDRVQKQPTFDSILAKRDELHVGQGLNDVPTSDNSNAPQQSNDAKEGPPLHSPMDIDRKRMSVSPQLPDVARMSVFGADFFSSGDGNPNASSSTEHPVKQEQPLATRQSTSSPGNLSTLDEKPRESEDNDSSSRLDIESSHNSSLLPANDPRSVPPLRTPSPNTKGLHSSPGDPASTSSATDSNIAPTEPLHPRQQEYSPSNYEPNSALTQGTMNTFNSSPIKESDVLSEEIMRSLSPIAPTSNSALSRPATENTQSLSPGGHNEIRNSSYTLSDYDSYWADSNDKPERDQDNQVRTQEKLQAEYIPVHEQQQQKQEQQLAEQSGPEILASSGPKPASPPESPNTKSRRRFSWEAGFDSPPKVLPVEAPAGMFDKEAPAPTSSPPVASPDIQSSQNLVSDDVSQSKESPRNIEPPKIVIPSSGGISHQVSKASTLPPSQQPTTLEPPSPVSVDTDDAAPQTATDRRPSVVEDKPLAKTASNLTSATPPPERSSKSVPPSSGFPATTPWRDIMSLATPVQRTLKFEAGRDTHQAWESGLDNWLSSLMTEHPEYANSTASFSGAGGAPASQKGHTSGPSVSHTQQPYYQQYLNASSPTTGQPATGRSRLGSSVPSGSSGFGNSSNQIGTKSKELMQSAGKMGKGLFSKGKSKLRGTGDKGEPTSPVQTKLKTERRASWGLERLTRSRADESSEKDVVNSRPSTQSYHAPKSSQSSSIIPFEPLPSTNESGKQVASRESDRPRLLQDAPAVSSREHDDRSQWYIPTPIDESTWDPFRETNVANVGGSTEPHVMTTNNIQPQQNSNAMVPSSRPLSGDTTPVPTSGIRMVPSEELTRPSHQSTSAYAVAASQETSGGVQDVPQSRSPAQLNDSSTTPQRQSSFVGLPPIRRGSTFNVNSKSNTIERRTTEPIDEHASVDDEDYDEIVRQQGTFTSEVTAGSTLVGTDSIAPDKEWKKDIEDPETPAMTPEQQRRTSQQRSPQEIPRHSLQMHPANQGPMPPQNPEYQSPSLPLLPPHLLGGGGNPVQRLPPSGPWKLEESHLSEPLHRVTPKASPLLPSGQWKLEESHLAEPLHVVNRNRAGTNASQISQRSQRSQHDPYFGYNKETGDVPTSPSSSSTTQHHQHPRQKPSEVPPSTTNRYPGLFPGQQQPQSNSQENHSIQGSQFIRRLSQDAAISRAGTGGNEATGDDRGRSRASALFKDIGHRFRKSSNERRSTPAESHNPYQPPQLPDPHNDAASMSSMATDGTNDRKQSRASFMLGLRSKQSRERLSMHPPPPRPDNSRPNSAMEDKRASRLNPDLGLNFAQQRPAGVPRAATSNLANELSQSGSATPTKKRFSAFNAKAAMSNVFNRPSSGTYSKPSTPTSSRPISSHLGAQQPISLERSHPGFERSNTAGPTFNEMLPSPPDVPPVDASDRRRRRGSAAGLISGLLGHGHKNKEPQQSAPSQMQDRPTQQTYDRRPSGSQLSSPQPQILQEQDRRPSGSQPPTPALQIPGAFPETPGIPTPQSDAPPLASPQPQRPRPFVNQQPQMIRQMPCGATPQEQSPMLTSRVSSGAIRETQHAQAAYRNSRPSPLGFGSTTPAGTPPVGALMDSSRHGTPQTPFSVGQAFSDTRAERMRSISPAVSGVRSAPTTQTSFNVSSTAPTTQTSFHHHSSQSFEKLSQHTHEVPPIQRPVTDSPNMFFRQNARPGQVASDDGMPLSPVSQVSRTGPPSVSSMATQSPRLNTAFPASARRQSSQLSQPDTPVISTASTSPPVQAVNNRMGMPPQQQFANVQPQAGPRQHGYQIAPGQQYQPNLHGPHGNQYDQIPHPPTMSPGRPPMQMQQSDAGAPVPPKDGMGPLQQPQAVDQPARQGSPGVSKWKGLKNRMSAQVAHKSQLSQGKNEAEKDKLTASKILGAFKRNSKENRQSMVIPDFEAYQQHQMEAPQQRQHPRQHSADQTPTRQTQSRPSSHVGGQPFGQVSTSRPISHLSNQSAAQLQSKRQSSMFVSPPLPQQQFASSSGSIPQGQSGMGSPQQGPAYQSPTQGQFLPQSSPHAPIHSSPQSQGHFQSPAQHQGQFQSPLQQQGQFQSSPRQGQFQSPSQLQGQFQSPPQPQGQWQPQMHSPGSQSSLSQSRQASYPGQWQGSVGQSPNSPAYQSPRHSHFSQQPYSPQHRHSGHQMVYEEESHPVHVSTPDTVHAPTPVHAPSPRPSLLNLLVTGNVDNEGTEQEQRDHTRAAPRNNHKPAISPGNPNSQKFAGSDSPYSSGSRSSPGVSTNPSPAQHVSPKMGIEHKGSTKSQAPTLPMPNFTSDSTEGGFMTAAENTNRGLFSKPDESHGVPLSPPTAMTNNVSTGSTGQSPSGVGDMAARSQPNVGGGPSFHAELEDTEDARKRTLRINSQEEKIHYDPNADSDGEVPVQMSATSYPGQEWNPYGMPEMGDWNEASSYR